MIWSHPTTLLLLFTQSNFENTCEGRRRCRLLHRAWFFPHEKEVDEYNMGSSHGGNGFAALLWGGILTRFALLHVVVLTHQHYYTTTAWGYWTFLSQVSKNASHVKEKFQGCLSNGTTHIYALHDIIPHIWGPFQRRFPLKCLWRRLREDDDISPVDSAIPREIMARKLEINKSWHTTAATTRCLYPLPWNGPRNYGRPLRPTKLQTSRRTRASTKFTG